MKHLACLIVATSLVLATSAVAQPVPDHLECYKIKDPQAKTFYTAELNGLVAEPGCVIMVPAIMACVPTTKTNVVPTPPGEGGSGTPNSFACYKIRCPKATLPPIDISDQFGSRSVRPLTHKVLCAPVACVQNTCADLAINCGTISDGCNGTLN